MRGYSAFKTYFTRMVFDDDTGEFRPLWVPHPFAPLERLPEECAGREEGLPPPLKDAA